MSTKSRVPSAARRGRAPGGVHTKLADFSHTTLIALCCDDVVTPDDGNLLVVDDELFLREAVATSLRFLGFEVTAAENGTDALRLARNRPFDLLILDVMLPDVDGFEIVRRLRRDGNQVPVIFLTAKDTQDDKVTGLTIGGDDYMTKPFGLEELAARVRTVLRRTRPAAAEPVLSFADLTLDQDTYEVRRGGRLIELSPTEFRLLRYFMLNPGRVLTRAQLLDHVWDYDFGGSSTVVSTYVTYLRRKLASDGPELIHTQRAVGYCLRLPRPGDEASPEEVRPAGPASGDRREVRAAGEAKGDDKKVSAVQASPDESQASSDES
jgi:two-component system OmpR family response regulator